MDPYRLPESVKERNLQCVRSRLERATASPSKSSGRSIWSSALVLASLIAAAIGCLWAHSP